LIPQSSIESARSRLKNGILHEFRGFLTKFNVTTFLFIFAREAVVSSFSARLASLANGLWLVCGTDARWRPGLLTADEVICSIFEGRGG
jgi:hypothetical protein